MTERKIQAVLFDIGETLLNFGKVDIVALFKEGGLLAYNFLRELNQPTGSLRLFLFRHLWVVRLFSLWSYICNKDFDSLAVLRKLEQYRGVRLTEQQWQEFAWCWYEPLSKLATVEADIKQTLHKLKQLGLKLGILSNTFIHSSSLERHLDELGILEFFNVRIYSYQFPFRKPDRRIFVAAARQLGCLPQQTIFVGDRIDVDVKGALAAGMTAVLKAADTNSGRATPAGVIRIDALSALPAVVERLNG